MVSQMSFGMQNGFNMINPPMNFNMMCNPMANPMNNIMCPPFLNTPYTNFGYNNLQPLPNLIQPAPSNTQNDSIFGAPQNRINNEINQNNMSFTGVENSLQNNSQDQIKTNIKTEEQDINVKTNIGKKIGIGAGILTPIARLLYKVATGSKASDVLKLKELGMKIPLFALAGWCVGAVIDGIINSKCLSNFNKQNNNNGTVS